MKRLFRLVFQLFLALLNATLLLALALAVVAFLVLGRIQDIGAGAQTAIRDTLAPQLSQFENLKSGLAQLDERLKTCEPGDQLRQQIDGLQSHLNKLNQGLERAESAGPKELAQKFLLELGKLIQERLDLPARRSFGSAAAVNESST